MGKAIEMTGQKFNRWFVQELSHQKAGALYWKCVCECGTKKTISGVDLRRGTSKSCGCFRAERVVESKTKHGASHHPAYASWRQMWGRCTSLNHVSYDLYGARGIAVCERWRDFSAFLQDMIVTWKPGLSLDRIDNDGNYEPGNVKWSTPKEQAHNRRTNRILDTPHGPMNVTEAARVFGIPRPTLFARLRQGYPRDRLLAPVNSHRK